ncbi:hypothetical protein O0880_14260 [Janthinobacterium sp. SUN118]|uniref:hypothetical protein n=1 Tax=Janthinobacterium sp. SUN118 TaxID=3004100 RepID=UPI0025B1AC73|nr:hypothetical protein [Janthinobacterium sp. SUN118]MDN2710586.1 hypothetical protein [Janthinobacterium sp. SUN118]
MSISELPENILNTIKNRFNNTFLASAIISWPIINYKLMLVLFGDGKYSEKIDFIDDVLYSAYPFKWVVCLFVFPMVVGFIYWRWYPFFDTAISKYTIQKSIGKAEMILAEERKIPFDRDEQVTYFKNYEAEKDIWKKALQEANKIASKQQEKSRNVENDLAGKWKSNTLKLFAMMCDIKPDEIYALKKAFSHNDEQIPPVEILAKIKNYQYYDQMKYVAKESINIPSSSLSGRREVSVTWLKNNTSVQDDHEGFFLEILWALEIIILERYSPITYIALDNHRLGKINMVFDTIDAAP